MLESELLVDFATQTIVSLACRITHPDLKSETKHELPKIDAYVLDKRVEKTREYP
jgi:hypothetical protein